MAQTGKKVAEVTREQLAVMNRLHRKELRQLEKMTEQQFQVFRKNFSFGRLQDITLEEARALLLSMLSINLRLQNDLPRDPESL